jgi:hypothetical protein
VNDWPGQEAASRLRQWPRILDLADRVSASPWLAGLLLLGSFARSEADSLSDVDFIAVVADGHFDEAWERRHHLHPERATCWDYPRPDDREVAAHRWLTDDVVLFDGLIATPTGARIANPLVVLVGDSNLVDRFNHFDPAAKSGNEIELHEVERLYGQLKLAARVSRED